MSIPANIRSRFAMPKGVYLLNHSVGCQPKTVKEAVTRDWLAPWAERGSEGWGDWLSIIDRFRMNVGQLISADPEDICPQTNLSDGLSRIIGGLSQQAGRRKIVLCEEDFPTMGFVAAAAQQFGYEPSFIPAGQASSDLAVWKRHLEEARLALVTHTFSNRSARLPVPEITSLARQLGVTSIVDAVQASGVIPYSVSELGADFVLGTSVKFLCGGSGAGFLWADPETVNACEPVSTGWFSHDNPFEFDIKSYRPAARARRFWGGTPSIAPFAAANCGIEEILSLGVENIHQHNQDLIDQLHQGVRQAYLASEKGRDRRGNAVLIRVENAEQMAQAMKARSIYLDIRDGALRLSPHFYNTKEDMDVFLSVLEDLTGLAG